MNELEAQQAEIDELQKELASVRFVLAERDKEIVWLGEELERTQDNPYTDEYMEFTD